MVTDVWTGGVKCFKSSFFILMWIYYQYFIELSVVIYLTKDLVEPPASPLISFTDVFLEPTYVISSEK